MLLNFGIKWLYPGPYGFHSEGKRGVPAPPKRPRMGLLPAVGSADLFKEEGEYLLFLERIFHWTCMQALLSPRMSLNPRAVKRLRIPRALPPGSTQNKAELWWAGTGLRVPEGMNPSFNHQNILHL